MRSWLRKMEVWGPFSYSEFHSRWKAWNSPFFYDTHISTAFAPTFAYLSMRRTPYPTFQKTCRGSFVVHRKGRPAIPASRERSRSSGLQVATCHGIGDNVASVTSSDDAFLKESWSLLALWTASHSRIPLFFTENWNAFAAKVIPSEQSEDVFYKRGGALIEDVFHH